MSTPNRTPNAQTEPPPHPHTAEWDRAVLCEVMREWESQNYQLFGDALTPPTLSLTDAPTTLGGWRPDLRALSLQRALIRDASWVQVVEVLRHEMAHQYVSEVLKITHEPPHGPTFRAVCEARGIDAQGRVKVELSEEAARLLRRIERLLALAESDNEHEATLAAAQAQALITQHHLSVGGAPLPDDLSARAAALGARQLGAPKRRHFEYEHAVAHLLKDHFFVRCIWVSGFCARALKRGRVLEVCGRHEDLEISEYVYHFLMAQLERSWASHARKTGLSGARERLSYCLGVVQGFHHKLNAQREELLRAEGAARPPKEGSARALLALTGREVESFLNRRYPHTRSRSGGGWRPSGGYAAGVSEGRALTLHKGVQVGPSQGARLALEQKP